jgi:benzoyl-CoA reductase subunit D
MSEPIRLSAGIDVGTSMVKAAIWREQDGKGELLAVEAQRIRKRMPSVAVADTFAAACATANVSPEAIGYIASTGDEDAVQQRRGHFYSMTTHARGGLFLVPEARAALDVGALHGRAIRMDERGRVLSYRMTSQCASGSGQFLENISRYLGVALDEVGPLSKQADQPEVVSNICAVLAETDVINMVSRGISAANILKGIHLSMAGKLVKLLKSARVEGTVALTGGLAQDTGLVQAMEELIHDQDLSLEIRTHAFSLHAGAIGAAIHGAYRDRLLERRAARV